MNDLSMHILDIIQNSLSAKASLVELLVWEDVANNLLTITIKDNGKGMTPQQVEQVIDPFFTSRTTRRVGLGLPLYRQTADQSGGTLKVESVEGIGTTITATFVYNHIDRPPMGNLANAVVLMMSANPNCTFDFSFKFNEQIYSVNTHEINEALDGLPINDVHVIKIVTKMIDENIKEISKK